jgi:hypothetical protein
MARRALPGRRTVDHPRGVPSWERHGSFPVARRTSSRHSASAASPRRWCSSDVRDLAQSPRLSLDGDDRRLLPIPGKRCWIGAVVVAGLRLPRNSRKPRGGRNFLRHSLRALRRHDRRCLDRDRLPLPRRGLVAVVRGDDAGHHGGPANAAGGLGVGGPAPLFICPRQGPRRARLAGAPRNVGSAMRQAITPLPPPL